MTTFKRSSKQPAQESSLPKYLGNGDNAKVKTTRSATVQDDVIPNDAATQNTRENIKESGDQLLNVNGHMKDATILEQKMMYL